ncbi:hypothetical protein F2Q69_00010001 [Brassica cretica]|uniref:Uncharacterized protein n=1 Tax=Brassica cretica TaxID=69181 RepID=A0A8S9NZD3_BRACR|nr:hypothetical protein F2Q69_00010001 [Brassica cretica]
MPRPMASYLMCFLSGSSDKEAWMLVTYSWASITFGRSGIREVTSVRRKGFQMRRDDVEERVEEIQTEGVDDVATRLEEGKTGSEVESLPLKLEEEGKTFK